MTDLIDELSMKERLALSLILRERRRHTKIWGDDHDSKHSATDWFIILGHYLGKAAYTLPLYRENKADWKKRLIQIAAICLSALVAGEE